GVGLGADDDFKLFGEPLHQRGRRLDESLSVLTGLLSGEPVSRADEHHAVNSPAFLPRPIQGTIPIWVDGWWPNRAPLARARRYDGVVPGKVGAERGEVLTADDFAAIRGI